MGGGRGERRGERGLRGETLRREEKGERREEKGGKRIRSARSLLRFAIVRRAVRRSRAAAAHGAPGGRARRPLFSITEARARRPEVRVRHPEVPRAALSVRVRRSGAAARGRSFSS